MPQQPLVSIIVSTWERVVPLCRLLESLAAQTYQFFEVILIDKNQDDRLEPLCHAVWSFPLRHFRGDGGVAQGRNQGLTYARGQFCLFPDDDCYYDPSFLANALTLLQTQQVTFVCGRTVNPKKASINGRYSKQPHFITRDNCWTAGIEWCLLVSTEALRAVQGWNTQIGLGASTPWGAGDGQDLMLRLLAVGYTGYFDPSIFGYHVEFDKALLSAKGRMYARGHGYVLRVHHFGVASVLYWAGRPLLGCFLHLAIGKVRLARYYGSVCLGRLEGYFGVLLG